MEQTQLSKILKEAMKGDKFSLGVKESMAAMKGAKAVLCTRSVPTRLGVKLREEAKKHEVPIVDLDMTSAELARMIGKPYKVSTISLRSLGEASLKQLLR